MGPLGSSKDAASPASRRNPEPGVLHEDVDETMGANCASLIHPDTSLKQVHQQSLFLVLIFSLWSCSR